jgi:hypothetical protein
MAHPDAESSLSSWPFRVAMRQGACRSFLRTALHSGEDSTMADIDFVKHDQGGVNARILAKETKADFRRVEAASIENQGELRQRRGQAPVHPLLQYLSAGHPFHLGDLENPAEPRRRQQGRGADPEQMDKVAEQLNKAIDGAEALFQANGITSTRPMTPSPWNWRWAFCRRAAAGIWRSWASSIS